MGGPQYRHQNTMILIIETPKKGTTNLGKSPYIIRPSHRAVPQSLHLEAAKLCIRTAMSLDWNQGLWDAGISRGGYMGWHMDLYGTSKVKGPRDYYKGL